MVVVAAGTEAVVGTWVAGAATWVAAVSTEADLVAVDIMAAVIPAACTTLLATRLLPVIPSLRVTRSLPTWAG